MIQKIRYNKFYGADRQKTDFRFLIFIPKNMYFKNKNTPYF